jgi:short-subunit dehydrogenase
MATFGEISATFAIGLVLAPLLAALTLLASCFELLVAPCCARKVPRELRDPAVVLITGATSGLGAALAAHYARAGRMLLLTGRSEAAMRATAEACKAKGAAVKTLVNNDLATEAGRVALRDWARARDAEAPIDLVVANAGVDTATCGADKDDVAEVARRIFAINVDGAFATAFATLDAMRARGRGQIALIASLAAFAPLGGSAAYSASKAALKTFGESLRWQLMREGVRVNVVCPGYVESGITRAQSFKIDGVLTAEAAAETIASGLARDAPVIAFPHNLLMLQWLSSALPPVVRDCVARNRLFGGAAGYMRPSKGGKKDAAKTK